MNEYRFSKDSKNSEEKGYTAMKISFGCSSGVATLLTAIVGAEMVYRALTGECAEIDKIPWYVEMAAGGLLCGLSGYSVYYTYRVLKR